MSSDSHDTTVLLQRLSEGDKSVQEKLISVVKEELHRLARKFIKGWKHDLITRTTDLFDEVYIRLFPDEARSFNNRKHFIRVAILAMLQILTDDFHRARRKDDALRNLSFFSKKTMNDFLEEETEEILHLIAALDKYSKIDERKSSVVILRFILGLNNSEIAKELECSERTVGRDWNSAKSWLKEEVERRKQEQQGDTT